MILLLGINAENAVKNIRGIIISFVILAVVAGMIVQISVNESDLANVTTLAVEIVFGIFIALVVYIYSKHQQNQSQVMTETMDNALKEMQTIMMRQKSVRTEIRHKISLGLNMNLDLVLTKLEATLRLDGKYCSADKFEQKEHYRKIIPRTTMQIANIIDLRLGYLEMMEIYGGKVTEQYRAALWVLRTDS